MQHGIELSSLLRSDKPDTQNALADALGDSFLCANNPIFARVRDYALQLGYRFSPESGPLWQAYQAFPLTCLTRILAERTIPYFPNKPAVEVLEKEHPGLMFSPKFLVRNVKPNHAFHESGHCIAHTLISENGHWLDLLATDDRRRAVWESVLAESFANSIEKYARYLGSSIAHTTFYSLNSYIAEDSSEREALKKAMPVLGRMRVFTIIYFSFVCSNLRITEVPVTFMEHVADIAVSGTSLTPEQRQLALSIAKFGFTLSLGFRQDTSDVYYRLLGCENEFREMTTVELLRQDREIEGLHAFASLFANVAV